MEKVGENIAFPLFVCSFVIPFLVVLITEGCILGYIDSLRKIR